MKHFSLPRLHIKKRIRNTLLFHSSAIFITILVVGALCSVGIVIWFAYVLPEPKVVSHSPEDSISINKNAVMHIQKYEQVKQRDSTHVPLIPAGVFYVPPKSL